MSASRSAVSPLAVSLGMIVVGVLIAVLGGLRSGSILGGLIAASAAIPAGYAAWRGMQGTTQAALARALGVLFLALGIGGLLILLRLVDWFR